jgi:monoamine oxidase
MQLDRRAFIGGSAAIIAGAAPRRAWAQTEADVIIIGAGLAGLHAAHMLEAAGQRVVVLEGSNRIGGRLHTLDDLPGRPEAGGVQVGSGYARLIAHAERLGIPLIGGGEESRDALYRINGVTSTAAEWPTSAGNRLSEAERAVPPAGIASLYNRRLQSIPSPAAWRDSESLAALDRPYGEMLGNLGASAEAIRLINANLNGNFVEHLSAMNVARASAIFRSQPGPVRTIGGGSQRLPEAMAANLRSEVRFNARVIGIAEERGSVIVGLEGANSIIARQVICTIPFSILKNLPVETHQPGPVVPLAQYLQYTKAVFLYLSARAPFWLTDGFPSTLWSDDPMVGRVFALSSEPPVLKVWIAGFGSIYAGLLQVDQLARTAIEKIEAARPSARGQLSLLRHWSWQEQQFASGIYHHISPGLGGMLSAAATFTGRRLHFAGEHLAIAASGMEGALESGERAAQAVLAHL